MLSRFCKFIVFGVFLGISCRVNAARLDISRLTSDGEFSATLGAAFRSGLNSAGTHQINAKAGRIRERALDLAYTPTSDLTLVFSTNNSYSDSQLGFLYKLIKYDILKLDIMADYGIAWTKNAQTHSRYGNNNFDFGGRITGRWINWQWSFVVSPQFVWAEPANFWNINTDIQLMYYLYEELATNLKFEFDILEIQRPRTKYDKSVLLGVTYNFTHKVSAQPFVKYHFRTQEFRNTFISYYDWWEIGLNVSAQF